MAIKKVSGTKCGRYYIGIDEAGRGPLAGPVSVGLVAARTRKFRPKFFKTVRDSKHLSPKRRAEIFEKIKEASQKGDILFSCSLVGPSIIDRIGILPATHLGIRRCLYRVPVATEKSHVLLDGTLRAPKRFILQDTIIHGDEIESLIALASIVAKVIRDKKMERMGKIYPYYDFHKHKGYGTKHHFKMIKKYGLSEIHRTTFVGKS